MQEGSVTIWDNKLLILSIQQSTTYILPYTALQALLDATYTQTYLSEISSIHQALYHPSSLYSL